jgi:hypothetical protein
MTFMVYSGAREKPKSKISYQNPFKMFLAYEIELEEKFSCTK